MRFYCTIKIEINKKEVGIAIKSKETHIASYLANWLPTIQAPLATICVCLSKKISSWVVTFMDTQMKQIL